MAPSNLHLCTQLRFTIYYHLDNDLLDNALFLAERLYGLDPRSPDAIHLLALCHFRSNQFKLAFDYSQAAARRALHLGCSYVFAQTCLRLGRHPEGIDALEKIRHAWDGNNDWVKPPDSNQRFIPDAPAVMCLLGKLYKAEWRTEKAIDCWAAALKLNPFMWEAFEDLCKTGTHVKTSNIFKLHPDLAAILSARSDRSIPLPTDQQRESAGIAPQHQAPNHTTVARTEPDPFSSKAAPGTGPISSLMNSFRSNEARPARSTINLNNLADIEAPMGPQQPNVAFRQIYEPARTGHSMDPPNAPLRKPRVTNIEISADPTKPRSLSSRQRSQTGSEDLETTDASTSQPSHLHKRTISGSLAHKAQPEAASDLSIRRSRRLFNQIRPNASKPASVIPAADDKEAMEVRKAKATGTKGRPVATSSTVGRVVSGNRKPVYQDQKEASSKAREMAPTDIRRTSEKAATRQADSASDLEAVQWWLDVLEKLGQGYHFLSQYDSQASLQCFYEIGQSQRDTPWVLSRIGKGLFEQNNYAEAGKAFARVRKIAPSSLAGMEVYSTVLWHEKKETELAFISHELLDIDRSSPEAWCTIGNAFSLQRDHEQALKCFRRATQLNPRFAYGYTLQGHEHIESEKYDDALAAYRRAISVDQRHYNGWYGLGKVYEKLGENAMAEKHYRAAASINPKHAVLYCCIGYIMEKQKQPQLALEQYDKASQLQPIGSQALFRKARLLLTLRQHHDAIKALNLLRDIAPNESNVHFMLGRAYARLHNKGLAVKHYTTAMNLDPKAASYLKEQMEALDEDEDYDDDDEDEDDSMTG